MKTIIIHYFTGTGNTAHSVKIIAEKLRQNGYEIEIVQVKKDVIPLEKTPDFHIIAFPVLSWSAPVLMKKYITSMSSKNSAPAAILAINGALVKNGTLIRGYSGQALEEVEKKLNRKKYEVFLTGMASYPDNWTQMTNPSGADDIKTIFSVGDEDVNRFFEKFITGKKELYRCGTGNIIWSSIVAFLFGCIGRRVLGQFFIADAHCTNCGICVKTCPVNAIKAGKHTPYWGTNCEDCNRCINSCPEKAIQVSIPLFIIQIIMNFGLTIWALLAVLHYIPQVLHLSVIVLMAVKIIASVAVLTLFIWITMVPLDAFYRLLMKVPAVRRFFCISYTSKFRRYLAPGFKPMAKL